MKNRSIISCWQIDIIQKGHWASPNYSLAKLQTVRFNTVKMCNSSIDSWMLFIIPDEWNWLNDAIAEYSQHLLVLHLNAREVCGVSDKVLESVRNMFMPFEMNINEALSFYRPYHFLARVNGVLVCSTWPSTNRYRVEDTGTWKFVGHFTQAIDIYLSHVCQIHHAA